MAALAGLKGAHQQQLGYNTAAASARARASSQQQQTLGAKGSKETLPVAMQADGKRSGGQGSKW